MSKSDSSRTGGAAPLDIGGFLRLLDGVRSTGHDSWMARCPHHDDRNPSLSVKLDDGKILLKCFAGCETGGIVAELGLAMSDLNLRRNGHGKPSPTTSASLSLSELAKAKHLDTAALQSYGVSDELHNGYSRVRIPYFDEEGNEVAVRYRGAGKRFHWRKGDRVLPYGLDRLLPRVLELGWILVVEGESDCWTAWHYGIPALGAPGKGNWQPRDTDWKPYLQGLDVYVWQEPDGCELPGRVLQSVPQIRVIHAPQGIKDISEAHIGGLDVPAWLEGLKQGAQTVSRDGSLVVANCDAEFPTEHDLAHAKTLSSILSGELRWAAHRGSWRLLTGHAWKPATEQQVATLAANTLRGDYVRQLSSTTSREAVKRITTLINETCIYSRIQGALNFLRGWPGCHTEAADWDKDGWCLNVANGVLDLRTMLLRPHSSEDLYEKMAPANYLPDATCPKWNAHMERFTPNPAIRRQVQRDLGRALVGFTLEESLSIWYGTGANGKTTTTRVAQKVLGDYACKAAPNLLVRGRYERHPTELADLCGSRLVFSVETDADRQLNETFVKELTGGDTKKARFMNRDFFHFEQTFDVVLVTNHKPGITGSDEGIWRRVRLVPWEYRIPENEKLPQDEVIAELMTEASGILNWLLAGLADWKADHYWVAPEVLAATQQYRSEQDALADYLSDRCEFRNRTVVGVGELYDDYTAWCVCVDEEPLTKKQIGTLLRQRGLKQSRGAHGRARFWEGLRLRVTMGDSGSIFPYENVEDQEHTESSSPSVTLGDVERGEDDELPSKCHNCNGTDLWQRLDGEWMCCTCHPQPPEVQVG